MPIVAWKPSCLCLCKANLFVPGPLSGVGFAEGRFLFVEDDVYYAQVCEHNFRMPLLLRE